MSAEELREILVELIQHYLDRGYISTNKLRTVLVRLRPQEAQGDK